MATAVASPPKPKFAPPKVATQKMFIDGKWVESVSGKTFETINPSTGDVICAVAEGDKAGCEALSKTPNLVNELFDESKTKTAALRQVDTFK